MGTYDHMKMQYIRKNTILDVKRSNNIVLINDSTVEHDMNVLQTSYILTNTYIDKNILNEFKVILIHI